MNTSYELALSKSETFFQLVWEKSIDGMRLIDENGIMLLVNDAFCRMTEMQKEELIGNYFSVIYHPDDRSRMLKKEKERFISRNIAPHFERELTLWNGNKIWFELSNNYLQADDGSIMLLSIFRNITERKRVEFELIAEHNLIKKYSEELYEINASKDKFFSIISHDLKSPFQSLLGISDLLSKSDNSLRSKEKEILFKQLNKALHNQYKLLENLLQWSRLQTGRMNYQPQRLDLGFVVNETINLMIGNAARKDITLTNNVDIENIAYADLQMTSSILQNFLSNAIKFTPRNGTVTVDCRTEEDYFSITVSDTGVGIHEEELEKLFRLDCTHSSLGTENEAGTGLGLIICWEMAEINCGRVKAESIPNKGSKFTFTVPKYYEI